MKKALFIYEKEERYVEIPEHLFIIDSLLEVVARRDLDIEDDDRIFMEGSVFLDDELIKIANPLFGQKFDITEGIIDDTKKGVDIIYEFII